MVSTCLGESDFDLFQVSPSTLQGLSKSTDIAVKWFRLLTRTSQGWHLGKSVEL